MLENRQREPGKSPFMPFAGPLIRGNNLRDNGFGCNKCRDLKGWKIVNMSLIFPPLWPLPGISFGSATCVIMDLDATVGMRSWKKHSMK